MDIPTAPITIRVERWEVLRSVLRWLDGYVFRGHGDTAWPLASTFERDEPPSPDGIWRLPAEARTLDEFQRRAHHYVRDPPNRGYTIEWMALLRHFGGPSRLLDVSRSPYVAAFFALNDAKPDRTACIWAVHEQSVSVKVTEKLQAAGETIDKELLYVEDAEHTIAQLMDNEPSRPANKPPYPFVACIEPHRLNERISIQQGLFILPLSLQPTLYEALLNTLDIKPGFTPTVRTITDAAVAPAGVRDSGLVKVEFPGSIRSQALKELHLMNVSAATLYPGLEGFAQSLRTRFSIGAF